MTKEASRSDPVLGVADTGIVSAGISISGGLMRIGGFIPSADRTHPVVSYATADGYNNRLCIVSMRP